ncbi:hypothetical protein PIB30_074572 [Stylosanthes scabra]|uniref:Secreted protein n=1 Tax=Stylosanthes scabra TaxID=79078 RepID=A0ABU6ZNE9_9FABA|nr:hypothetical protein [Stylosanthes scabra]
MFTFSRLIVSGLPLAHYGKPGSPGYNFIFASFHNCCNSNNTLLLYSSISNGGSLLLLPSVGHSPQFTTAAVSSVQGVVNGMTRARHSHLVLLLLCVESTLTVPWKNRHR